MKIILWSVLMISVLCPASFAASDSEVSKSLDKMAKELVSAYQTANPKKQKTTMAILPFNTSEELAKRKTGNALAELLTHSFRKYPNFALVERVDLNKIFSELKLNMSGAVDQDEALKIGKLSGASLQVLGSMEKIGSKYNINARMVQTETGDIVATAFKTVPASLFDEEAKYYLVDAPVPKTQAIGIYLGYLRKSSDFQKSIPTIDSLGSTLMGTDLRLEPLSYAVGARYDLSSKIQFDYIYYVVNYKMSVQAEAPISGIDTDLDSTLSLKGSRFLVAYKLPFSKKINSYSGFGVAVYTLENVASGIITQGPGGGNQNTVSSVRLAKNSATVPVFHERLEYRPQSRIAVGLSITYELGKKQRFSVVGRKFGVLSQFHLEPTIGVYF
ncbi:MAG: FlgO family outer membrane protein [Elusimicrobiota bacterium]|nr:FlgO family outer membrane protein [Elusimicrobiota bacterium]